MIMHEFIMYKDIPVLEIDNYVCSVLDYKHLPYALKYDGVNYDDVYHGWTETRVLNISKTNAKNILAGYGLSQNNKYAIARKLHFATLTDCFWIKDSNEDISWNEVSLFRNPFDLDVSSVALSGGQILFRQRLLSPEISTLGVAAKTWVWESNYLYLYKVGKKEIAASLILDALGVDHVHYEEATENEVLKITDYTRLKQIVEAGEKIVKCKCFTSEQISLCTWEDFRIFNAYHDIDEFKALQPFMHDVNQMNVADYIIGNSDRHEGNWGFLIDNATGELLKFLPLMDHDHAFINQDLLCQPFDGEKTLKEVAAESVFDAALDIDAVVQMKKPDEITEEQWQGVLQRCEVLSRSLTQTESPSKVRIP